MKTTLRYNININYYLETESVPFVVGFAEVDAREAKKLEAQAAAEQDNADEEEPEEKPNEPAQSLEKEAVEKLLSRAEPIKSEEGDEKNFAMRGTW